MGFYITEMKKEKLSLVMDFEEEIRRGTMLSSIYEEIHRCVQQKATKSGLMARESGSAIKGTQ